MLHPALEAGTDLKDDQDMEIFRGERDLHFNDIINCALDCQDKSDTIIELLQNLKNEINKNNTEDGKY